MCVVTLEEQESLMTVTEDWLFLEISYVEGGREVLAFLCCSKV